MKRKRVLPVYLVAMVCLLSQEALMAQIVTKRSSNVQFDNMLSRGTAINPIFYDNIDGSPFLNDEFVPGTLVMKNGMVFENIPFRLNTYTGQMEFLQGKDLMAFSQPNEMVNISMDNQVFIYGKFFKRKKAVEGYFQLLADGYARLLLLRYSDIRSEKRPPSDFGESSFRNYFRTIEEYYITKDGKTLIPLRQNNKSILKAFSEKEEEMKTFLSESKLDPKNNVDLGEIVFYFNQLMKEK